MRCPTCQHTESRVLESRSAEGGCSIRRRRECLQCSHRFTTYERIELAPVTVIKRDGVREPFESFKLLGGIAKACEKTEVSEAMVTAIAQSIETEIQRRTHREIASTEIGNLVLEALQPLSEVAYVRFASVYHQFKTAQDFAATLDHLNHEGNVALGHNVELGEEEHSPGFDRRSPASALPG